jgi:energy-coupling factor transport system substrate-specific component
LTGLLTDLLKGLTGMNVPSAAFAGVAAVVGILAGLFAELGWMRLSWKALLAGLITGLIAAVLSAPISAYVFAGVHGAGTDALVAIFRGMGFGILPSTFAQGVTSDPLDKMATFFVVWLILQALPVRFLTLFPRAAEATGER